MNHLKNIEPSAINNDLITNCLLKYGPTGEAGRLYAEDGVRLEETSTARLEFQKIIRMDHLWMMTSLRKLSLAHNNIEKIENLEQLTQLNELDLSFNKINKIENLHSLVKLEVLTLFSNKIMKLENLYALEKLLVFSIGDNLIEDFREFSCLRRFRFLRSVSLRGNPCCQDGEAYLFIKSALVKVTYLDYKMITAKERAQGLSIFREELRMLDEEDEVEEKKRIAKEEYNARVEFYALSFVEYLSGPELFETMFEKDPDGRKIIEVCGDVSKYYDEYKQEYIATLRDLVNYAQDSYIQRKQEIEQYKKLVDSALADTVKKSQVLIAEFKDKKAPIFQEINDLIKSYRENKIKLFDLDLRLDTLSDTFNESLYVLWRGLMTIEMDLFEQCEESRVDFSVVMTDMITKLLEEARTAFGLWRELEIIWSTKLFHYLPKLLGGIALLDDVTSGCLEVFSTRDTLLDCIAQSVDNHMRFIDAREDTFNKRAISWRDEILMRTNKDEIKRNRDRVLEINFFTDNQREEWIDLELRLEDPTESESELLTI